MNADEHRLSPDPSPSIASPRVALDDGLQDPDGLRTEAAERNNVAKTTILHDCSTDSTDSPGPDSGRGIEGVRHYGVDPEQNSVHGGAALASLKRAGLDSVFELLEGPSHLILPKLLEKGVTLDLAFIDGWHTFDYTLLDFFYLDKMLRPGGVMLLHDRSWPSKQKVMRFIMTHRRYKELPVRSATKPGFFKWLRRVIAAKWHWLRGAPFGIVTSALFNRPEIAAFLKLESFEPDHRFFRNF